MPQIREQIAMVHLPPSKTLKYLFHVRKTKENPQKCGFFLCLCGLSGFLRFALIAYFLRFFAFQWHRKSTGKYRKMPPPVMDGILLRLGLDEVFIHWVSTLGICLCFHTAAICAGCSILISKEVLLRFVYGVLTFA